MSVPEWVVSQQNMRAVQTSEIVSAIAPQNRVIVFWHLSGSANIKRTAVDTSHGEERGLTRKGTIVRCIAMRAGCRLEDVVIDEIYPQI